MFLRLFRCFFFFVVPLNRKRETVYDRPIHKWNKPSHTADKPRRMILFVRPDTSDQTDITILPCQRFARFHATVFVAVHYPVALVVTRFESAPSYQIGHLRKHRHINPGLRNYRCGCAFFNSGDYLKTFILFGKVFLAHGGEYFLTLGYPLGHPWCRSCVTEVD